MTDKPPKLAQRILLRFLRNDLAEEVLGDLEEKFYSSLKKKSRLRAKLDYWYQTFNYLRPFAIRRSTPTYSNHFAMLQNYFKIGWRHLSREKMYSAIKIGGFAMGIAACLLIALFIRDELSYDLKYPDGDRIYRVVVEANDHGETIQDVYFQPPLASVLKADYPEIEKAGRFNASELFGAGSNEIRRGDRLENTYEEGFTYFDQELLDILQPAMIAGNPKRALDEPNTIVITKRKADKYFPNEDPLGKILIINNQDKKPYKIGGVIEDFPANGHLHFDFLITMKGVEFWPGEQSGWGSTNYPTYILVNPGANVAALEKKITKGVIEKYILPDLIKRTQVDAKELVKNARFILQPLRDIHLYSDGIYDGVSHGDIRFVWLFGAIAGFILIIACINFINLSTAKSANRAKEVGLRKVVGSFRSNIINQFLTESLLYSIFSFAIGIIAAWLLLPYFNLLSAKSLIFPWKEWWMFPTLALAAVIVGILARATWRAFGDSDLLQQLIDLIQNALRPVKHPLALLRHHHTPRGALQQLHGQSLFQQPDALADIGNRAAQLVRCGGKAGFACHHGKDPKVIVVQ